MNTQQPKAMRLADELDDEFAQHRIRICNGREAAAELRRLYTENEKLKAQCQPLTDKQVTAAARVLNDRCAESCGIDKDDEWAFFADDFKADARAAIEAAHGIGVEK